MSNLKNITKCLDGVAVALDENTKTRFRNQSKAGEGARYFNVRYTVPGLNNVRTMRILAVSATDAVGAVKASCPNATIVGVD